ncbi:MAG: Lcl C-terminal domain-containing protein [Polaromonas sp.]
MISARRKQKRVAKKQGVIIATTKPKPAAKPKALAKKELDSFLALHVGEATDAYLRGLALVVLQSRQQLNTYQRSLTKAETPKGKLIKSRYFVANNGTVADQQTSLMWMQSPLKGTFTFDDAQQAAQNLNAEKGFAGHTDWRVPDHEELFSLVVEDNYPSICQEAFPETPEAWFWTSTPHTENVDEAWLVDFSNGRAYDLDR